MQSQAPNEKVNILQEWTSGKPREIDVLVRSWYYSVTAGNPRQGLGKYFSWQGVATTKSKDVISVTGEFIIADGSMQSDWGGHLFEVGEVRLFEGENEALYPYLSVEIRINEMCCDEITKSFALGLCCRDEGRVLIRLRVKAPTADEWAKLNGADRYKDRDRIVAVDGFSVYSAGGKEEEVV
jgi:hypothetical protein